MGGKGKGWLSRSDSQWRADGENVGCCQERTDLREERTETGEASVSKTVVEVRKLIRWGWSQREEEWDPGRQVEQHRVQCRLCHV